MAIKNAWKNKSQYNFLENGLLRYLHRRRVVVILETLNKIKESNSRLNLRFVDLGCGEGVLTRYIVEDKRFDVVGVGIDINRLKRFKNIINDKKTKLIVGDIFNGSDCDSSFY